MTMWPKRLLLTHLVSSNYNNCLKSVLTLRYVSKGISSSDSLDEIKKCCDILKISYDFNDNELRNGYLESCRRTHPDLTGDHKQDTSGDEFDTIQSAYNRLKDYLRAKDIQNNDELNGVKAGDEEEGDEDKHILSQHRQYLTMDGVGSGTHAERDKYYRKHRLMKATDRVNEFQINKIKSNTHLSERDLICAKNSRLQREGKVKQGFDRLVEDMIQESMAKGDFDNLSGYGKPLKSRPEYPYMDSTTFKLNEILINNGFVPEWVLLEKEIRHLKDHIKTELISLKNSSNLDNILFVKQLLDEKVKDLNKMINKYNTIVPILRKQQILMNLDKEIQKMKQMNDTNSDNNSQNEFKN